MTSIPVTHACAGRGYDGRGYDGRVFHPADTGGGADAAQPPGERPTGRYHQDGELVWADFSGGSLRVGRLVGVAAPDGTIDAAYCQVMADGEVVAGRCVSRPTPLPGGRIRLAEHWVRHDGSTGVSYIDEADRENRHDRN